MRDHFPTHGERYAVVISSGGELTSSFSLESATIDGLRVSADLLLRQEKISRELHRRVVDCINQLREKYQRVSYKYWDEW